MNQNSEVTKTIVCTEATTEELQFAIQNRLPIAGIKAVVTHVGAHLDEIFSMYLMMKTLEGQAMFPGLTACIFQTEKELAVFAGEDGFYLALTEGYICIGTLGGPFDEHGQRDERGSVADIMTEYLGFKKAKNNRDIYGHFLNYVNYEDRNGNGLYKCCTAEYANIIRPALIADNVKKGWTLVHEGLKDPHSLLTEVFGFIENEIGSQRLFVRATKEYKTIRKDVIALPFLPDEDNKKPALVIVHSDNAQIVSVAKRILSADETIKPKVILKVRSNGQFSVHSMNGTTLVDVVKNLRVLLSKKRKLRVPVWQVLDSDGSVEGLEEIYYHLDGDTILNGSLTQPDVTGLIKREFSITDVVKCIVDGLDPRFHFEYRATCLAGTCAAMSKDVRCPMFLAGLEKCRAVRSRKKS